MWEQRDIVDQPEFLEDIEIGNRMHQQPRSEMQGGNDAVAISVLDSEQVARVMKEYQHRPRPYPRIAQKSRQMLPAHITVVMLNNDRLDRRLLYCGGQTVHACLIDLAPSGLCRHAIAGSQCFGAG